MTRKATLVCLSAVMMMSVPAAINAAPGFDDPALTHSIDAAKLSAGKSASLRVTKVGDPTLRPMERVKVGTAAKGGSVAEAYSAPRKASASDIKTEVAYVQVNNDDTDVFYTSAVCKMKATADSLEIVNFNGWGETVKAAVNWTKGTFTIDPQVIFQSPQYGPIKIYTIDPLTALVDSVTPVSGKITGSSLEISSWCALVTEGEYKDYYLGKPYTRSKFGAVNAVMKCVALGNDSTKMDVSYDVWVEQPGTNVVNIYNFAGLSSCVSAQVRGDNTLSIVPTMLFKDNNYGSFFPFVADWNPGQGLYYPGRKIRGTIEDNTLKWGNWVIATSNGSAYYNRYIDANIELETALKLPAVQAQAGFKGAGTAEDPYLIETVADLLALADSVNTAPVTEGRKYARAYEGKYFKQTKAINLNGLKFPGIGGYEGQYRFAGTYDGDNKNISNLNVEAGGLGYAGLFGATDTCSVIKNVKLASPVINSAYYYAGSLVGCGYGKIDNCHVTNGTVNGYLVVAGVAANSGDANNCSFTGKVTGNSQVGGVIGAMNSKGTNLFATGTTITATGSTVSSGVGGVVATLSGSRGGELNDCYFAGTIVMLKAGMYAGGLAGWATQATIKRSFAVCEIKAMGYTSQSASGGLVGAVSGCEVYDCYFAGDQEIGSSQSGSLFGFCQNVALPGYPDHSYAKNCYVTGHSRSSSTDEAAPFVGYYDTRSGGSRPVLENCYYDKNLFPQYKGADSCAVATTTLASAEPLKGFDDTVWTFAKDLYPRLTGIDKTPTAYVSAATVLFSSDEQTVDNVSGRFTVSTANSVKWQVYRDGKLTTDGRGLNITSAEVNLTGVFSTDTLVASNGAIQKFIIVKCSPKSMFEGEGTAESPYLIKTKDDLIKLYEGTTVNKMSYDNSHFLMTNDIDLEYDENFKGLAETSSTLQSFGGTFDGGGYAIHRMKLTYGKVTNGVVDTQLRESYRGFIGRMKASGVVKNLTIAADCDLKFYSTSGAFVGQLDGGQVLNCKNFADVTGYSSTCAGIVGYTKAGSLVKGCYNAGKITVGYQYAGGIVGTNYGLVENCQNDGEVCTEVLSTTYDYNKLKSAGGVVHANFGEVRNVLNTGYVHTYQYAGGIMGFYNSTAGKSMVESAVNLGRIEATGDLTVGNVVGKIYKVGTCANVYWDKQISTHFACDTTNAAQRGKYEEACPSTTADLTSGKALTGLDPELWQFEKGKYPVLKAFADEPRSIAAANAVAYFPNEMKVNEVKADADLNEFDGLTWSVTTGSTFKIDGDVLSMHPGKELTDTLVATYKGYSRKVVLIATPDSLPAPEIDAVVEDGKLKLTFTGADGAKYHYTLDASEPTEASESCDGEVLVDLKSPLTVKAIAAKHNFYPSNVTTKDIDVSAIDGIAADTEVTGVTYISPEGRKSLVPFDGVNIVVTTYADGRYIIEKKLIRK